MKPSRMVSPDEALLVVGEGPRFVGRGGEKLAGAVERFDLAPAIAGARALDAGASTGGFTDCLLQNGAACVVAVDVGYGQLHERLRADPRVEVQDRTNVRELAPGELGPPFDIVVADLSFISLRLVLPALLGQAAPGAPLVTLLKPQFEAGKAVVAKGRGIVRDPAVWRTVLEDVGAAIGAQGATIMGGMVSPIHGADGNVEFLLHVAAPTTGPGGGNGAATEQPAAGTGLDLDALVEQAIAS
jgi:23S rRNA (cytidine1920-2'-O)/16S rRNA (cytidine1409-2'-O)-methyltransferase